MPWLASINDIFCYPFLLVSFLFQEDQQATSSQTRFWTKMRNISISFNGNITLCKNGLNLDQRKTKVCQISPGSAQAPGERTRLYRYVPLPFAGPGNQSPMTGVLRGCSRWRGEGERIGARDHAVRGRESTTLRSAKLAEIHATRATSTELYELLALLGQSEKWSFCASSLQ